MANGIGRLTLRQKYKRREKGRRQHTLAAMARILVGSEADLKDPGTSLPTTVVLIATYHFSIAATALSWWCLTKLFDLNIVSSLPSWLYGIYPFLVRPRVQTLSGFPSWSPHIPLSCLLRIELTARPSSR